MCGVAGGGGWRQPQWLDSISACSSIRKAHRRKRGRNVIWPAAAGVSAWQPENEMKMAGGVNVAAAWLKASAEMAASSMAYRRRGWRKSVALSAARISAWPASMA